MPMQQCQVTFPLLECDLGKAQEDRQPVRYQDMPQKSKHRYICYGLERT
jgi:hypothetical protein